MALHTPVSYWLTLPLGELFAWTDTLGQVAAEDRAALERG